MSIDIYSQAQTVICISEKVRDALRVGMKDNVRAVVVYNGTDPQKFFPADAACTDSKPQQSCEILVVGNLLRGKGHELVLNAIARLRSAFPHLRCQIVGEGPDRARFAELASTLGIAHQVQFLGRWTRNEVANAMRNCAVFVLPSTYEGLGCVYLEAMACGKPIIGCEGQGIDEVVEHGKNGWLIPVNNLEHLVQGLSTLLSSTELRSQMGMAARQTVLDRFTLLHQAQGLVGVYEAAIQRGLR